MLGLGLAGFTAAFAQTAPLPAQGPSCETVRDQLQEQNLNLRKRLAQAEFQAAAVEEIAVACQKKAATTEGATKAAEAPKPPKAPDVGKK